MIITTKANIKITSDNGTKFEAKAGWIGEVPQWVENHWYFKALCKDGTVTEIVKGGATPVTPAKPDGGNSGNGGNNGNNGNAEIDKLRSRAAELKIPNSYKLSKDNLIAAIKEAEGKINAQLDDMDATALRKFAENNGIDLTGVSPETTAYDLRLIIKTAPKGK
jgi:hypothetical protein